MKVKEQHYSMQQVTGEHFEELVSKVDKDIIQQANDDFERLLSNLNLATKRKYIIGGELRVSIAQVKAETKVEAKPDKKKKSSKKSPKK